MLKKQSELLKHAELAENDVSIKCERVYVRVCMCVQVRAVRYHPKYAYHDIIALVSRYTLGIDTLHDMT